MSQMRDVFKPSTEPARSIYEAFQDEAAKRKSRPVKEWMLAECEAVFLEAKKQADKHQLRSPTMEEVIRAERYASGAVDYGAKWAWRIVDFMRGARKA